MQQGRGHVNTPSGDEIDHHDTWESVSGHAGEGSLGWCLEQLASQSSILLWIEEHTYCTVWDCSTLRVNSGNPYEKWVRTQQRGEKVE